MHLKRIIGLSIIYKYTAVLLALLFSILVGRTLSVSDFGKYNLAISIVTVLGSVLSLGTEHWLIKEVSKSSKNIFILIKRALFLRFTALFIALLFSALAFILGLVNFELLTFLIMVFCVLAMLTAGSLAQATRGLEKADKAFQYHDLYRLIFSFVFFYLFFFLFSISFESILFIFFLSTLIGIIFNVTYFKKLNLDTSKLVSFDIKNTFLAALPFCGISILAIVNNNLDVLMLGFLSDTSQVAGYSVGAKASLIVNSVTLLVVSILAPRFSRYFCNNEAEKLKQELFISTVILFFFGLIIIIAAYFLSPLLALWGEEYLLYKNTFLILVIAQVIMFVGAPLSALLTMTNKEKLERNCLFLMLAINVLLGYFLIHMYGALGASLSTLTSIIFVFMVRLISCRYLFMEKNRTH
mgnify:CR=1 FL=1